MAAKPFGVWGIDLGQCALKALRLETDEEGVITATAFDYVEHPKILSQPDADPDQLTREALEKFLSRNTIRGDQVAISVPGQSGLARFVKLPPVEEKKIGDIVKFEAKQQIPFNLEEVVWDYQKIGSGAVTDGFAMETEIGLFAMKRDMVNRYLQHFKDVNVEVHIVQMAPLALCNFVAYDLLGKTAGAAGEGQESAPAGKKQCIVALDIGADSSNLVITDGARIIWQRPIPLGGNHFTRALTKDMKLTFAKAEHLKRNATKSPDLKQILSSLKPVLNDFVGEVQRSLGYFTNTHRDAHVQYMVGLGSAFRLPGLQRFLGEKLQMDVRRLSKLERLTGDAVVTAPAYTENVLSYAVAYGLALQGLKVAHLRTNLLPPEIQVERMVRAKKPWAAAAAAALLLGATGLALSYALEVRAYGGVQKDDSNPVQAAEKKSNDVVALAANWNNKFKTQVDNAEKEERAVKSIIAGQDERKNWIKLNQFISSVLPYPECQVGTNAPPGPADFERANLLGNPGTVAKYLTADATNAFIVFCQKQLTGRAAVAAPPTDGKDKKPALPPDDSEKYLVSVNIENVDARFTDDLAGAWNAIKSASNLTEGMVRPSSQFKEAPKEREAGWVVELRGYTFHKDRETFLVDTLVENIARRGGAVKVAPAPDGKNPPAADQVKTPTPPAIPDTPAPAAGKTDDKTKGDAKAQKDEKKTKKEDIEPILGNVSHVTLFKIQPGPISGPLSITGSLIDVSNAADAAAPKGGGDADKSQPPSPGQMQSLPPGVAAQMSSGPRARWRPLSAGATGAGGAGATAGGKGAPLGAPSGGSGNPPPGYAGGTTTIPGSPRGTVAFPVGEKSRTEFVVIFLWREPIPSDKLRSMQESTKGSSSGLKGGQLSGGFSAPPPTTGGGGGGRSGGGND